MTTETTTRIVRIVEYNTDNEVQAKTTPVSQVKQIAKHANIPFDEAEAAINEALEDGRLEEVDGRLKVAEK